MCSLSRRELRASLRARHLKLLGTFRADAVLLAPLRLSLALCQQGLGLPPQLHGLHKTQAHEKEEEEQAGKCRQPAKAVNVAATQEGVRPGGSLVCRLPSSLELGY